MTAVRLRGQDATERAIEVHRLNTVEGMTVQAIADMYDASPDVVGRWLKEGRKYALPAIDDGHGWVQKIIQDWGSRLDDSSDGDAVRLGEALSRMLGIGSAAELEIQKVRIEGAKVAMVAQAFDRVIDGMPNQDKLRAQFVEAMRAIEA